MSKDKLRLRIPWLIEAAAEGPFAITVVFLLTVIVVAAKSLGIW